jgi:hypothetical protein
MFKAVTTPERCIFAGTVLSFANLNVKGSFRKNLKHSNESGRGLKNLFFDMQKIRERERKRNCSFIVLSRSDKMGLHDFAFQLCHKN